MGSYAVHHHRDCVVIGSYLSAGKQMATVRYTDDDTVSHIPSQELTINPLVAERKISDIECFPMDPYEVKND